MVRAISTLTSNRIHQLSLVAGARSVVMVPNRSATTVLGVVGMKNALTTLSQGVVGLIGTRERVLLLPMEDILQDACVRVAVPQQSTRKAVSLTALRGSHMSPPHPRYFISLKIRLSLSIHSNMTSAFIHWILDSDSSKAWRSSVLPVIICRCSRLTLLVPDTL